jgi:hypothetical protein
MKISHKKKILSFIIIILFVGAVIVPSITGYSERNYVKIIKELPVKIPLNNDYINSFWKMDECSGDTVEDSSAHSYDGSREGASWDSNGYSGCALDFDGVDDYVDFTSNAGEIMFNKTDDIILSFYFKSSSGGLIFSATAPWGNNPEFRIELMSNNGTLLFYKITQLCGIILYSNGSYNDNEWHHAEYYYNGITSNPTLTLFIDGDLDTSFTHWLCEIENDDYSKATMGMHSHTSSEFYDGLIDEFKIIKYEGGNDQDPPIISGPTGGEPEEEIEFTFTNDDPEEDDIQIMVDWGDGDITDWSDLIGYGDSLTLSHSWDVEDEFCIKAKSKDFWYESKWSDCYDVKIGNQPPAQPTITGPKCGEAGEEMTYNFVSDDHENHDIYYYIDWGDGSFDDWFGPYSSGETASASHSWDTDGMYEIKAKGKDILDSESSWSEAYAVRIGDNSPPEAPDIDGPKKGNAGEVYGFIFVTTDPDGDDIVYEIDWGDGTTDEEGPILSGEEVVLNHGWELPAVYTIKARARDEPCNTYSDWSEMEINIPRNRALYFNIIKWLNEKFPCTNHFFKYLLNL